jgi:hypothetical protein
MGSRGAHPHEQAPDSSIRRRISALDAPAMEEGRAGGSLDWLLAQKGREREGQRPAFVLGLEAARVLPMGRPMAAIRILPMRRSLQAAAGGLPCSASLLPLPLLHRLCPAARLPCARLGAASSFPDVLLPWPPTAHGSPTTARRCARGSAYRCSPFSVARRDRLHMCVFCRWASGDCWRQSQEQTQLL